MTDVVQRVRDSFARQPLMATIGAVLEDVAPGRVTIRLPFRADLTQQHGYLHAGIVSTIADNACGFAALSLMEEGTAVLTAEFKLNLLSPAQGEAFWATGRVIKAGRTLTVAQAEVEAIQGARRKPIALMVATLAGVRGRGIAG